MLLSIFNHNGVLLTLYMVIIMLIAIMGVLPQFSKNSKSGFKLLGVCILALALALYPVQCADFYHLAFMFQHRFNLQHIEDVFIDLWEWEKDYFIWRLIVFGGAILFMVGTIKLLKLNTYFSSFIFVITEMFMFGNLRNMLGLMALFFFVVLFFYNYTGFSKIFIKIIAVTGLILILPFHKSILLYELLLLVAFIPFGKNIFKISLIAFPFLWMSIFSLSSMLLGIIGNEEMMAYGELYTTNVRSTTLLKNINEFIRQSCYLYLFYLIVKQYIKPYNGFPTIVNYLIRYSYILIYIGFLFCGQGVGGWLYERIIGAGEVGLMFLIMYFFYNYPRTKYVKFAFGGLIYYVVYQIIYISTYANSGYVNQLNGITI